MNFIYTYLLEVVFISGIFWVGFLLIRKSTTPSFKRFYLLGWLLFSILFPVVSIPIPDSPKIQVDDIAPEVLSPSDRLKDPTIMEESEKSRDLSEYTAPGKSQNNAEEASGSIDWEVIIVAIYLAVSLFFLARLLLGVLQVFRLKRRSVKGELEGVEYYIVDSGDLKGASFFSWLFIGKDVDNVEMILNHEKTHARLFHSMDILLSNLYRCFFWINPFAWPLVKFISLNTELETDYLITRHGGYANYANALLSLSLSNKEISLMNHLSARHLKSRIVAMKNYSVHRRWVSLLTPIIGLLAFWVVSCDIEQPSDVIMAERLQSVKTITTRFTSHQNDTKQKTGKIVAIASFLPDGTLDEFVEKTTYPYDREFETKKYFWDAPDKSGLPYVMDGLTTGDAEKTFLYGNDWPIAYAKYLKEKSLKEEADFLWKEVVNVDNETLPTEIERKHKKTDEDTFIELMMPDVTEYFEYDDGKVINVKQANFYIEPEEFNETHKRLREIIERDMTKEQMESRAKMREQSGEKFLKTAYTYEGDKMTSVKSGDYERRHFYENNILVRSEYYKSGTLLNSRMHYYKDGLKDRTEIFNRYNEPEYTITYEYEFW